MPWSWRSVILFDPIFQGWRFSLMAGEVASLLISRMAVPVIYYHAMRHVPRRTGRDWRRCLRSARQGKRPAEAGRRRDCDGPDRGQGLT